MSEAAPGRLRWRCRRGMRELDRLLERWLDEAWPRADAATRQDFERLLETEDDRLWRWFMGKDAPDDAALRALIHDIATRPA